ncbi:hypothetical protein H5V45_00430 [Nocardioides sp. KIGAM211]|uniref:Peptidase S55 domain-containing protein n=1 Tax=Nocardioides luti TaxID=2761101 RepID=A0A7X0RCN5_9ACTN|nr:SpoIVB peptidase S55 domain-containing protein [Nocardioides luti]MBB6625772.1 hypothetical protein [Nocardioides luti]
MSRGRALVSLAATIGLSLSAAAVVTGATPAQSAEPAGDCKAAYPVGDLARGDDVTGLTVTSGTTPTGFTGDVIGVLDDGIGPDLDMVIVELSSPEIDRVGGIWQGMSGSPVYASDGRLIGAVAYGLSYGASPVAGVTPFADMDDYLASAGRPGTIEVSDAQARAIARSSDVSRAQAAQGFSQLKMPLGVSGVSAQRLAQAKHSKKHAWLPKSAYSIGAAAAPAAGPGPETVVAGGNLAASLSYGDVTQAGVGTATSVCNGKVVGFGHPLGFLGETSLTLHPADALYIQKDTLGPPFKVANLGAPAGTITDDHLTGITGSFAGLPETSDVTSTVTYRDRSRTGASHVSVPEGTAGTVFYEAIGNHDRVVDGVISGSELLSWTINGHQADGSTFSLPVTDRYASDYDITFESSYDLADFTYALSAIKGVTIDDVTMTSAVDDDNSTYALTQVQQRRGGKWVTLGKGSPAVGKPGKKLHLRTLLTSPTDTRYVKVSVGVPSKLRHGRARIGVFGGSYNYSPYAYPSTLARAKKYVDTYVRNDQVVASFGGFYGGEEDVYFRGGSASAPTQGVSAPQAHVVTGSRNVKLVVR